MVAVVYLLFQKERCGFYSEFLFYGILFLYFTIVFISRVKSNKRMAKHPASHFLLWIFSEFIGNVSSIAYRRHRMMNNNEHLW